MCVLEDLYHRYGQPVDRAQCLHLGQQALEQQKYDQALEYFDLAAANPSDASRALEGKLQALLGLEDFAQAERCIRQALEAFPDDTVAYRYQALLLAREDRLDEAIACFDRVIRLAPQDENAYLAKSELLVKKGDYRAASRVTQDLLDIHPDSEAGNFQAGKAFFGLKQYDKALGMFGKVMRLNPANTQADTARQEALERLRKTEKNELRLALTLLDNKMYTDSLRHFAALISQGEDTAEVHYFLGKAYKGLGDDRRMVDSMERAAALAPQSTAPLLEIGEYLFTHQREEEALSYFDRVLAIDPANRPANLYKGEYLQKNGRPGEADLCYDRLLQADNRDAEAYLRKGISAIEQYPAAGNPMLYFDKAMEANPSYALPMYYRGQFQLFSGQKTRYALESFNKAAFLAAMSSDEILLDKCRQAIRELAPDFN